MGRFRSWNRTTFTRRSRTARGARIVTVVPSPSYRSSRVFTRQKWATMVRIMERILLRILPTLLPASHLVIIFISLFLLHYFARNAIAFSFVQSLFSFIHGINFSVTNVLKWRWTAFLSYFTCIFHNFLCDDAVVLQILRANRKYFFSVIAINWFARNARDPMLVITD